MSNALIFVRRGPLRWAGLVSASVLLSLLVVGFAQSGGSRSAEKWGAGPAERFRVLIDTREYGTLTGEQDADGVIRYPARDLARWFDIPQWETESGFEYDGFSFTRLMYESYGGWGGVRQDGRWTIDFPQADLNLSFRLQQLTSLKVKPDPVTIPITRRALAQHPFVYMVEPGRLALRDEEALALRDYLFTGGFLMVDDFWGESEWANFYRELRRVFPELPPNLPQNTPGAETATVSLLELPIEHPIFNCVFELREKPQMPTISQYLRTGLTYERPDAAEVHYKGVFDSKGRMMAIICHNTDLGDGWEREGVDDRYFERFSEAQAYPMAINIIFYAMTR
jgi:hypothetical protein